MHSVINYFYFQVTYLATAHLDKGTISSAGAVCSVKDFVWLEFHFLIQALRLFTIKGCFFESTNMHKLLRSMTVGILKFCLYWKSSPETSCQMLAFQFSRSSAVCIFWQEYIVSFRIDGTIGILCKGYILELFPLYCL